MNTERQLAQERAEHDAIYRDQGTRLPEHGLSWEEYHQLMAVPPHRGGTLYGEDHRLFLNRLAAYLEGLPQREWRILDYGCGTGTLSLALASLGARVTGFDLSEEGIRVAQQLAARRDYAHAPTFVVANAQALPFADASFDLVVGKAVLHHVIKYPGTETELLRVMKPGSKALFLEGAAGNPLIALARRFTIKEELGDVPLTPAHLRTYAQGFSTLRTHGYFFLYMLKRFGYYASDETLPDQGRNRLGSSRWFQRLLAACLTFDRSFINEKSLSFAGRYIIELTR